MSCGVISQLFDNFSLVIAFRSTSRKRGCAQPAVVKQPFRHPIFSNLVVNQKIARGVSNVVVQTVDSNNNNVIINEIFII